MITFCSSDTHDKLVDGLLQPSACHKAQCEQIHLASLLLDCPCEDAKHVLAIPCINDTQEPLFKNVWEHEDHIV